MEERARDVDLADLLAQSGWMEGLARRLVGTAGAEDLVQDTLVAVLEHPPAERAGLGPWLAVVLRRLARDSVRGEGNRAARERAAARREALPATADLVGRAEQQRLLVEAVLALAEPYRTVILLRHFEGLSAAEIARRRGVPQATVRSQCARAIETLRGELDQRHGGDRSEWTRALAVAFGAGAAPVELGGGVATGAGSLLALWAAGLAAVALLLAGGWWFLGRSAGERSDSFPAIAPAATAGGDGSNGEVRAAVSIADDGPREQVGREQAGDPARSASASQPAGASTGPATAGARIAGQILLAGGVPAEGAEVRLSGIPASEDHIRIHGRPADWSNPETRTSQDGRFELAFDPPGAFRFTLRVERAGFVPATWRWQQILPGTRLELGEVLLAEAATLLVHVADSSGRALAGEWRIHAEAPLPGAGPGRTAFRSSQLLDPDAGHARIEGAPAGTVSLSAYSGLTGYVAQTTLELEAREVREVALIYDGPDPARRILVEARVAPVRTVRLTDDAFVLLGEGVEKRSTRLTGSAGSYVFDDLDPGAYSVHLMDERFAAWSAADLAPGGRVTARLTGPAAVALRVMDAVTGEPVVQHRVSVRLDASNARPNIFLLRERGADPEPAIAGLFRMPQTLIVEAEGYGAAEVPLGDLGFGETRSLEVRLARPAALAGTVRRADGAPAAGATVQLVEPGERPRVVRTGERDEGRRTSVQADELGRFAFEGVLELPWDLHAWEHPWGVATVEGIELARGERRDGLHVELPAAARIRGRITAGLPRSCERFELAFVPEAEPEVARAFLHRSGEAIPLAADGSFDSGPLPPGRVAVHLRLPDFMVTSVLRLPGGSAQGFTSSGVPGRDVPLEELELEPGEERLLELDLGPAGPACATIRVEGLAVPDQFGVLALPEGGELDLAGAARLDAEGSARLGPLAAGRYRLHVHRFGAPGRYEDSMVLSLAPGEHHERGLAVRLAPGTLAILRAEDGQPLARGAVMLSAVGDPQRRGMAFDADGEGRLALELFPGRYLLARIHAGLREPGPAVEVEWTLAGPTVERVEL